MNSSERRLYPCHETEIAVTIHKDNEEISATMININEGGIGIISKRGFYPGTEVNITLNYIDDYSIRGTVKWARLINKDDKIYYRV